MPMQLYFIIIINQNSIKKRHYKLTGENIMFWIYPMTGNTRLTKEQENITYCIYCHPVNSKFTTCAENGSWVEFINTKRSLRYVWRRIIKVNKLLISRLESQRVIVLYNISTDPNRPSFDKGGTRTTILHSPSRHVRELGLCTCVLLFLHRIRMCLSKMSKPSNLPNAHPLK